MAEYGWRPGSRLKGDAQQTGEALAAILERDGAIKPAVIVEEARPVTSPPPPLLRLER